ncbi:MAG TPA: G5 domain-containing protein [Candidatus Saccharimonadales bacterium]|nr:G5 domain-containing protein [Candidatus Saccharimonadales bacterium]
MLQAPADSKFQRVLAWAAGIGFGIVVLGLVVGVIPPPRHILADSSSIVSVYFDGQEKVITTNAATVGDALQQAGVTLGPGDVAEPSVGTQIPSGFFNINVYRSRPVVVIDGSARRTVETASQSPDLIAEAAGFTVYPQDTYSTTTISNVAAAGTVGQQVVVHPSVPVIIDSDGQQAQVRTQQKTVGGLLTERDVALGPQDTTSPSSSTPITPNMVVQINRVANVILTQTSPIPFTTQNINDPSLSAGTNQVRTPGSNGQQTTTYRVHYQNGIEQSRQQLSTQVTQPPVTQVELVGTKLNLNADPVSLGQQMAAERGWTGSQWTALYDLWEHESGWNPNSSNFWTGACGIPQAYPCSKITDHSTAGQITWGLGYIAAKYGTPANAYSYWQSHNSY